MCVHNYGVSTSNVMYIQNTPTFQEYYVHMCACFIFSSTTPIYIRYFRIGYCAKSKLLKISYRCTLMPSQAPNVNHNINTVFMVKFRYNWYEHILFVVADWHTKYTKKTRGYFNNKNNLTQPRDLYSEFSYNYEIRQAGWQRNCRCACHVAQRCYDIYTQSCGLERS